MSRDELQGYLPLIFSLHLCLGIEVEKSAACLYKLGEDYFAPSSQTVRL